MSMGDRAVDAFLGRVNTDRHLRAGLVSQVWERRLVGTDAAEMLLHLVVDDTGRVLVHEAILAQLLVDAGWERTA